MRRLFEGCFLKECAIKRCKKEKNIGINENYNGINTINIINQNCLTGPKWLNKAIFYGIQ